MAKIYSSRQMLDPNMLSYMNTALQNSVQNERERNRMLHDSVRYGLGALGSAFDSAYEDYKAKRDAKQRYDEVMSQASKVQMADPLFVAAARDYSRTGSANPLTSYQMQKETAEYNRRERAAEAARKEEEEKRRREAEIGEARSKYSKAFSDWQKYSDPDNEAYSPVLANQAAKALDAIEAEYPGEFTKTGDETRQAYITERDNLKAKKLAAEEEKKAAEEVESIRKLNATKFLVNIDSKMAAAKTAEDRKAVMDEIFAAGDEGVLTHQEVTDAITDIRKQLGKQEELEKAIEEANRSAVAKASGEDTETNINEKRAKKELIKKARQKIKDGHPERLTDAEYNALPENERPEL